MACCARSLAAGVLFAGLLASGRAPALPDGYFDPTFPGSGKFAFSGDVANPQNASQLHSIVADANGNLLVSGSVIGTKEYGWLGELSVDGAFIATFGANDGSGRVTSCQLGLDCNANNPLFSAGPAPLAGQYLLVGNSVQRTTTGAHAIAAGIGNPITVNDENGFVVMRTTTVQADGKILVAGTGYYTLSYPIAHFGLVRFTGDLSSKDHTFNATTDPQGVTFDGGFIFGARLSTTPDIYETATSVLVRPDGRIVLVGFGIDDTNASTIELIQLNPDGSFDETFGTGGFANPWSIPSTILTDARAILVRDGRILIAAQTAHSMWGVMVDPNGGSLWVAGVGAPGCGQVYGTGVAIDSAGRVLFGGTCVGATQTYFLVLRCSGSNCKYDGSFGNNSASLGFFDDTSFVDEGKAIAFDRGGRLYVAGVSNPGDVIQAAGISRLTYDLIYTSNFDISPRGCLPPDCN